MSPPRLAFVSAVSSLDRTLAGGDGHFSPPLGVLTLASILRSTVDVSLIDLDHLWWRVSSLARDFHARALDAIAATSPDVIGFSTISGSYPATLRLAQACSRNLPDATIVLGGPQASVVDVETMEAFPFVDYIVRGEADVTLARLLDCIRAGETPAALPGITYRAGRRVMRNPNAPPISDLDQLPLPAFDLLPYAIRDQGLPIEAGRGCPFACTFCSTNDFFRRRFRLRSPHRLLADMRTLHERYGAGVFTLTHDMFTVDRRRIVEFCEVMLAAGTPFQWSCSARTDCVDRDLLLLMQRAGCYDVFFGIETGSKRMQKIIDKNLDLEEARAVFLETSGAGLQTTASIIVGYPEETPEDLRESIRFFGDLLRFPGSGPQLNILSPLAATPLTRQYRDRLYLDDDWTTISESGCGQDAEDQALIKSFPDIFVSFYALPSQTPLSLLRRLRDFLGVGSARCGTLLYALHLSAGSLLDVFDRWEQFAGVQSVEWYHSRDFARHLTDFAEAEYGDRDWTVRTLAKFYRAVVSGDDTPQQRTIDSVDVSFADGVFLLDCDSDIHAIFRSFRETGQRPGEEARLRRTVAVVRQLSGGRCEILEFPQVTVELLRQVKAGSSLADIVLDFELRRLGVDGFTARQVVPVAVEVLEAQGLLRRRTGAATIAIKSASAD